jgi:DinB superfamily
MSECKRIAHQLACTISGEAWYGDSLQDVLRDVTATQAATHPIPGAHSTWELISHLTAWVEFALGALDGVPIPPWPGVPVELDWPPIIDTSSPAWKCATDAFFTDHFRLVERIAAFTDVRLEDVVPGRDYNFYRLFQSTIQHAVYHAGQIALLKKASAKLVG